MHIKIAQSHLTEKHSSFQFAHEVKEFCRSFLAQNDLHYFYYAHYDAEAKRAIVLTASPEINRHLLTTVGFPVEQQFAAGIHYLPLDHVGKERAKVGKRFNQDQVLELIQPAENGMDMFGFATFCHQPEKVNFYFNHLEELYCFGAEFRDQAKALIDAAMIDPIIIPEGAYSEVQVCHQSIQGPHITGRELEVLTGIYNGLTAKQSAEQLNISPRTVEYYIENIKNKLGLNRKAELIKYCLEHHVI